MKKNEGITLIALILTIIILVILTAVTLNNVIGSNLIGFATKAAENYIDAAEEENKVIQKTMALSSGKATAEDSKVQPGVAVTADTGTETNEGIIYNYTDVMGRHAMVPEGFKVSTKVSEQFIEDGLVIQDNDGNEFVWIPCTKEQYNDAKDDVIDKDWSRNDEYEKNGGGNGKGWRDNYTSDDETNLNAVYEGDNKLPTETWKNENQITVGEISIGKYGGFYIARYEAGIPENASFYFKNEDIKDDNNYVDTQKETFTESNTVGTTTHGRGSVADTGSIKELKPVSKQGVQAWNYITQPNSKMVAENMYKDGKDSKENNVGVKSYLVDSQAWNHICSNIFNVGEGQSIDSTDYGNYSNNNKFITKPGTFWARHIADYRTGEYIWTIAKKYTTDTVEYSKDVRENS